MSAVAAAPVQSRIHRRAVVHLLVPTDLSDRLFTQLRDWFADDPQVMVAVERRDGEDRRQAIAEWAGVSERRIGQRRSPVIESTAAAEGLELPWAARRHAERLRLVLSPVPVHPDGWDREARELVERGRAGETSAMDELRLHHYPQVRAATERAVGGRRAADATDQVFGVAFHRLLETSSQTPTGFAQWLGAVTTEVTRGKWHAR